MPVLPAWDVDEAVAEAKRVASLDLRGVNITSDPNDVGGPDLASRAWDPLWEVCSDLQLPVHFHIGASLTTMTYFGTYPWESQDEDTKLAIGGTLLFIGNARVVTNIILSGMLDRHPELKMVSVESGVGWIPFILEALDYEMSENAPKQLGGHVDAPVGVLQAEPLRHVLVREEQPADADRLGRARTASSSRPTFRTRPACTPSRSTRWPRRCRPWSPTVQRKILGENAAKLYRL